MSDLDKSFTFLNNSIPEWLEDIARVEEKAIAVHKGLTTISRPKSKTDSTKSICHDRHESPTTKAAPSQAAQTDPAGNRKRTLALSGNASGPSRYRPRAMVVVSYDGDMQKSLELLVRAIATGRNLLRKAKMEAKMSALAALAGSSDEDEEEDDNGDDAILSKISYRPHMATVRARSAFRRAGSAPSPSAELFDSTDKALEQAQEQCERAAHVVLREGDCRKELQDVRAKLGLVLDTAKTQVSKSNARSVTQVPELQPHDTSDTSISSVEPSYRRHFSQLSSPLSGPPPLQSTKGASQDAPLAARSEPKILDIEVDEDESDEEEQFVMPPLRLTSRMVA